MTFSPLKRSDSACLGRDLSVFWHKTDFATSDSEKSLAGFYCGVTIGCLVIRLQRCIARRQCQPWTGLAGLQKEGLPLGWKLKVTKSWWPSLQPNEKLQLFCSGPCMSVAGHEWRLPETGWVPFLLYSQHTGAHQLDVCTSLCHLCSLPPRGRQQTHTPTQTQRDTWICPFWQKEQVWKVQWWAFVVAENVVTGDREVTQAVPVRSHLSLLSDRLRDLGFERWFSTKKGKAFFLASLAFLQKVSTTYHKIVSHTESVWRVWNMEKAEGFGGCAFPFKECITYLELSEMSENYIEGQPPFLHVLFELSTSGFIFHGFISHWCGSAAGNFISWSRDVFYPQLQALLFHTQLRRSENFCKKICLPFMNLCPRACPCQEEKGRQE